MTKLTMNIKLDEGAIMPTKAHDDDAGFDIYSRQYATIYAHSSRCFDTGVHIQIPKGYVGFLKSKSGLNVNRNLVGEGVIDSGYTGSIVVKLYNNGDTSQVINVGDKITQIVFLPIPSVTLKQVYELGETERGDKGFGSSGK